MSSALDGFGLAARRLCDALERPGEDRQAALAELLAALAGVYAAALGLQRDDFGEWEPLEMPSPDAERGQRVARHVEELVGARRWYWLALEPDALAGNDEIGCGDLVDDLQDIYADIEPGLRAWESGVGSKAALAFEWMHRFGGHWGVHATQAMRALHEVVFARGS
ncbi:DUF5063 domain-containing protein [Nannocystaceae bacterium ST9]